MDYWHECVSQAFDDAGIVATAEQITDVAECVEGAHETYGEVQGHYCNPDPQTAELKRLEKALKKEQDKTGCKTCRGRGYLVEAVGTCHTSSSTCWECNGEGKV